MASPVFLFVPLLPASRVHAWNQPPSPSLCWEIQAAAWYSFSVKCLELVIGFKYECTETDPAPEYADPCLFIPLPSVSCRLHMKYT